MPEANSGPGWTNETEKISFLPAEEKPLVDAELVNVFAEAAAKRPDRFKTNPSDMMNRTREAHKTIVPPLTYIDQAKQAVVQNYNAHRGTEAGEELTAADLNVVWFAKTLGNWKVVISSPPIRGKLWEVTYNGAKREVYVDVYGKVNNARIPIGDLT